MLSSDAEQRQLVKPSKFQPWGVQVVFAVPESVHEILPQQVVGGAVTRGWAAVALREGKIHAFPVKTSTLSQPLEAAELGHKLYHPGLASTCPLLALSSMDQGAHVHVYAANPKDGSVHLWRVGHEERTQVLPRKPQSRVVLPLEGDETVSCLSSDPIVIGTSWGRLFWCIETAQPLMLHAQWMQRPATSMLSRFLTSSSVMRQEPIHSVLRFTKDSILSVSITGTLEHWKVTTVAASHKANFEVTPVAVLEEALAEKVESAREVSVMHCNALQHEDGTTHGLNFIVRLTFGTGEPRVYWLQGTISNGTDFELNHAMYLNRFHASEIECVGLVTTHEHLSYAAFQYEEESLPVTVMALMDDSTVIHEVDLPMTMAPLLVKGTMGRDTVTHGWCALATSGLGLRGRWTGLQMEAVSATPKKRSRGSSPSDVATLTLHLRSALWHWYQNEANRVMRLPPSLQKASREDLEPAIVATATQLQLEGDSSSLHNPMKWHTSFLELLQHGGLYRSLSSDGRYALLGIGQEIAVYQALSVQTQGMDDDSCQPHGIADWLQGLQTKALTGRHGDTLIRYEELLALALQTATQYRQEQAGVLYDISSSNESSTPPTRLWTHHPTLQAVMTKQMEVWRDNSFTVVDPARLTTVVSVALSSFAETKLDSANGQERYYDLKPMGISLIQKFVKDSDVTAFDLSVQHEYYQGVCQICLSHQDDEITTFHMEPLLAEHSPLMNGGRDYKTGLDFTRFVLEWHADRGLYAHVLDYGQCCRQDVLYRFLETNSRVHQYQWIPAVRNQQLDIASRHLLQDAIRPDATLSSCHWSLSMAKLSNAVAQEEEKSADHESAQELKRQRVEIDCKMELIQAQQLLMETGNKGDRCLSPEDLLSLTLTKLKETQHDDSNIDPVQLCLIGLAICRSMEDMEKRARLASSVWAQSLLTDMASWKDLIHNQQHLTKQELQLRVLESTIFGQVLQQYEANIVNDATTDYVAYDGSMENLVLDQLGMDAIDVFEMKRLLRIGTHLVLPTERPMVL